VAPQVHRHGPKAVTRIPPRRLPHAPARRYFKEAMPDLPSPTWSLEELEERLLIGSTLVEGSTLSEAEAREVLRGRTVVGHPVWEARELTNYRAATSWLMERLEESPYLSVDLVLGYHLRLLQGLSDAAGSFKAHPNFTMRSDGSRHPYLHPSRVGDATRAWVDDFNHGASTPPGRRAAELYAAFQQIHPFDDGNGRIGRVLITYWLHWKHRLAFRFYAVDKVAHLRAVEATDEGDIGLLESFIADRLVPEAS
jgi:Fic family protein